MAAIVEMHELRKVYVRRRGEDVVAVEGLDLELGRPGTVHGFLGPNGSGKTTTIRCLLGLIQPTGGQVSVFGADSTRRFHEVSARVGAIVENPKMFPNFSARRNLALLARIAGIGPAEVDRVLDIVGLRDRARDTFASYSLGMKQRLAIAGALLKDPDLLILDEPANGLDPAGIAEMRGLIAQIAGEGKAVLVSSHQLAEVEQVCDDVTIISRGRLIETGPLQYIRGFAGSDSVVAAVGDRDAAILALADAGITARPRSVVNEITVEIDPVRTSDVTRALAERGHYLSGLRTESATLEAAFLNLTGEAPPPPGPPPPGPPPPGATGPADPPAAEVPGPVAQPGGPGAVR
ncbi:MAG: ABC transporter ATP-binding protein [Acidimicrobiia bacterium]|nr:ABC transporter ATP-binding protein [Acidimicrobiia bacterium]